MSNHTNRVWRNTSPSTSKQGPIKAVKAFSLKQGRISSSSTKSTSSPSPRDNHKHWSHRSAEHKLSPERKSPAGSSQSHSPSQLHKDKSKTARLSPVPGKWRANSADTIVPSYLTGQWPKDINSYHHYQSDGVFMCDKSTQTIDEWVTQNEKKKKGHRRSASFGQGDQLKLQYFKQHLQKSKEGSKYSDGKQHSSPVQGNHSALSLTAPPALCSQTKAILISAGHIPRQNMNRFQRNSVEGLNMEIEKLVSTVKSVSICSGDVEESDSVFKLDIPDGHRAPLPEQSRPSSTRSVDTQTPSSLQDPSALSILVPSLARPASISPETAPRSSSHTAWLAVSRSGTDSTDSKSSKDLETSPDVCESSPKPSKSCPFVREPPDGCEKVTVVDESRQPSIKEPMLFSPANPNQFVFKQSQGSAFCPLIKSFLTEGVDMGNQTISAGLSPSVEG